MKHRSGGKYKRNIDLRGSSGMMTAIHDDLFARDVIHDPYSYFGRLQEEDPVHWNEQHQVWIITRYADLV